MYALIEKLTRDSGSAAVEFAVSMPILALIIVGIFDFGLAVNKSTKLNNGARAAAQYALYYPKETAGTSSGAALAAQNATNDPNMTVASVTTVCQCIDSSTGVIGTASPAPSCTSTCGAGSTLGHFLTVTTQETFTPTINVSRLPVIGSTGIASMTLTGRAQIQVQ